MRRLSRFLLLPGAFFAIAILSATSAAAQVPAASTAPMLPRNDAVSLRVFVGAAAVQNVGASAGGALELPISDRLTVFGEGGWVQDAVTRRRLDSAQTVAAFLQASQGSTASGSVKIPMGYAAGGARVALKSTGAWLPYVAIEGGVARLTLQPSFVLGGASVTSSLGQYGVTLGSDLTGVVTKPLIAGAVGVRVPRGRWSVDASVGVISVRTASQATNILRAGIGLELGL